jgi:antirestriction protein ArdC
LVLLRNPKGKDRDMSAFRDVHGKITDRIIADLRREVFDGQLPLFQKFDTLAIPVYVT